MLGLISCAGYFKIKFRHETVRGYGETSGDRSRKSEVGAKVNSACDGQIASPDLVGIVMTLHVRYVCFGI